MFQINQQNRNSEVGTDTLLHECTSFKFLSDVIEKKIEHIKYSNKYKLSEEQTEEYTKLGENVIKNKKYAVVTMAGGQGTRLGHKGPKGTFKLEVENGPKFLFQILAENLEMANKKYDIVIPWYIMTSTENNEETVRFFEEHEYFGYPKDSVKFFMQGNLPLLFSHNFLILFLILGILLF